MTTTQTPDLSLIIRIEKLLAQSEDQGCTPEEREAFQAKALQLIERNRIDRAFIGGHLAQDDKLVLEKMGDFNGIYGRVRIQIVQEIAEAFDVRLFWSGYKNFRHLKAYGFKSDIERTQMLAGRLLADADFRAKALSGYDMKETVQLRRGFFLGYADEIGYRLRTAAAIAFAEADAEGVDTPGAALVLVDRKRQVHEQYAATYGAGIREAGGIGYGGFAGRQEGMKAGANADLSHQNQVGNQKALSR